MSERYDWQLDKQPEPEVVAKVSQDLGVSRFVAAILAQRGITDTQTWQKFTHPDLESLHDPFALHDMEVAVDRITTAVENGEKITIYGDYDVDGLTSTTIMKEALESIGAEPEIYIPNRFDDGYGPNQAVYERLQAAGTQLLITVDNGVSGHDPIAWAMAHGMDVVVTDHHELPDVLPDAVAVVHPRYPGSTYPFGDLSGAGVAFKVATALLGDAPVESMDLAALGAIADVVTLVDENRTFAQVGLQLIRDNPRVGLAALLNVASVDSAVVDETTVGFALAPRLNAIGRLGDATPGVTLLTTFDPEEAATLAAPIDETNRKRQRLVEDIYGAALAQAQDATNADRRALVLAGSGWHQGVLGIVASRIVEATGKPTLILTIDEATGEAKGSGRSVPAFNLFKGMQVAGNLFTHFGGHAMAAGMSLPASNIAALQDKLDTVAAEVLAGTPQPPLTITTQIDASDITMANYEALRQLAPFGAGNPQPVFSVVPAAVDGIKQIGNGAKHLRFRVDGSVGAIAFGFGAMATTLAGAQKAKIAFTMGTNTFRGTTTMQMEVKDIELQLDTVIDLRMPNITAEQVAAAKTYVFFDNRVQRRLANRLQFGGPTINVVDLRPDTADVVFVDMPQTSAQLHAAMQKVALPVGVLFFAAAEDLVGIPTRTEFGSVLRFMRQHPNYDKHQLAATARELHMNLSQVILAVQVFFQLKFVTIKGTFISAVDNPQRQSLEEAPAYRDRSEALKLAHHLQEASRADLRAELLSYRS